MDSKAECVQLNLAHVARKKYKKEKTKNKQTPVPPHESPQNEQENLRTTPGREEQPANTGNH